MMKIGSQRGKVVCHHHCPEELTIQGFEKIQSSWNFYSISDKIHRATSEDIFAQAWSNNSQSIFPQSWKKIGANVELFHMSTYQCSILLKNMGYGKVNSENHKNLNKPIAQNERYNITDLSLLREFWEK